MATETNEDEPESVIGHLATQVICSCGEQSDFEGDIAGETVECGVCGAKLYVREVR